MQILRIAQEVLHDKEIRTLAQHAIGGANPKRQIDSIRRYKPALIIGTPGRILDLIDSGSLHPQFCSLLVLDEVRLQLLIQVLQLLIQVLHF